MKRVIYGQDVLYNLILYCQPRPIFVGSDILVGMGWFSDRSVSVTCATLLLLAGCDTRTTSVRVADPSKLVISSGSAIALPAADATSAEQRATLRDDWFETEPGARAHYKVDAVRQNGEIALEWTTQVPILNGEHQTLVDRNGVFNDAESVVALIAPTALAQGDFRIDACAHVYPVSAKGAALVGYRVTEWNRCGGYVPYETEKAEVPFTLRTPWSNVVEIRDHVDVNVGGDIAIGIFGLGMLGGGGALVVVPKDCIGCVIGGATIAIIGALTSLTASLDIAQGPRDFISYPPKPVIH